MAPSRSGEAVKLEDLIDRAQELVTGAYGQGSAIELEERGARVYARVWDREGTAELKIIIGSTKTEALRELLAEIVLETEESRHE